MALPASTENLYFNLNTVLKSNFYYFNDRFQLFFLWRWPILLLIAHKIDRGLWSTFLCELVTKLQALASYEILNMLWENQASEGEIEFQMKTKHIYFCR